MRNGYLERQDEVVAKIKWRIAALEEARIEWVQQANESNSWNENGSTAGADEMNFPNLSALEIWLRWNS